MVLTTGAGGSFFVPKIELPFEGMAQTPMQQHDQEEYVSAEDVILAADDNTRRIVEALGKIDYKLGWILALVALPTVLSLITVIVLIGQQ